MTAIARLFGWTNPVDLSSDTMETKPVSSPEAENPVSAVVVTKKKLAESIEITVHYPHNNDFTVEKVMLYFSLTLLCILSIIGIWLNPYKESGNDALTLNAIKGIQDISRGSYGLYSSYDYDFYGLSGIYDC